MKNISTYRNWLFAILFAITMLMPQSVWAEDLTVAAGETVTIPANTYKEYGKLSIAEGGTLINNGSLEFVTTSGYNNINGTLTNNGNIFVGKSLEVSASGNLTNSGTLEMEEHELEFTISGTVTNQGIIRVKGKMSTDYTGGYLTIKQGGTLYNESEASLSAESIKLNGTLFNAAGASVNSIGRFGVRSGATLGNHGTIENGSFNYDQDVTVYNTGTIQNSTDVEFSTCTAAHVFGVRCSTCGYQLVPVKPALASDGYYEIGDYLELYWLAVQDNANLKARLTADIDATVLGNSVMIGSKEKPFEGTFEGNGKSITVNIDAQTENYVGLFRAVSGATIQNLTVKGSVKGKMYVGGIAGYSSTPAGKESKFIGCSVDANVSGTERVGGVVGCMTGVLESGISAGGKVTGSVSIDRCLSFGTITASRYAGGIVGYVIEKNTTAEANITISNCCFEGKMVGSAKTIGGLVGYMSCTEMGTGSTQTLANIQSCLSTGICNYVIGNAGYANVEHCYYLEAGDRQLCGTVAATSTIGQKNGSVTTEQLANGEAVYLLNNGVTDGSQVWYQNLTNGCFSFTASAEATIYYDYANCSATEKSYHNAPAGYETPGHVWTNTETKVKSEATCTADAVYYKECERCHAQGTDTWTKTGSAKGHTSATDAAVPATCTETGLTEGSHCSVCNEVLVAQEVVAAKGHTSATDAAVAPTCTETGLTEGSHCSVCNEVLVAQEVVAAKGHTSATDAAVAPTCTSTGKTEGSHCSVCNEVLVAQTVVPAKAHTFDEAADPTRSECSVCNHGFFRYTSKNNAAVSPATASNLKDAFGDKLNIVSNGYVEAEGKCVMEFSAPLDTIGDNAFCFCSGFTGSLTIPNSVTSIGESAFETCSGITSVTIPNSVKSIKENAFSNCQSITSMCVGSGNTVYDSRNNCNAIIETESNTLIAGCKNTVIPSSVTCIGNNAFATCTGLTTVNIPNSVTSIEMNAFFGCI